MKFFGSIVLSCMVLLGTAQSDVTNMKRKSVYVEVLGNGGFYSVNFDYILFYTGRAKIAYRVGAEYWHDAYYGDFPSREYNMDNYIGAPIELCFLYGDEHHLEFGMGLTPFYVTSITGNQGAGTQQKSSYDFIMAVNRIGYRLQRPGGGFLFRIAFTPVMFSMKVPRDPEEYAGPSTNIGLSFGWTFPDRPDKKRYTNKRWFFLNKERSTKY